MKTLSLSRSFAAACLLFLAAFAVFACAWAAGAQELPVATPIPPESVAVPELRTTTAAPLSANALLITLLVPVLIAGLKRIFPQLHAASLPVIAPVLGALLDYGLAHLGLVAGGTLAGAVAGSAGVGAREIVHQARKAAGDANDSPPMAALLLFLVPVLCLTPGCLNRTMKRYDPMTGKLWSTEEFSVVLMRGEASKLREQVKETSTGDYEREVSIGTLKGESETDKLKDLAGEVVERGVSAGVSAGIKAIKP